jgi:hypothetical protein
MAGRQGRGVAVSGPLNFLFFRPKARILSNLKPAISAG